METKVSIVGILSALLSGLIYSIIVIFVKMIDLHPSQISLSRCSIQVLTVLPFLQYKQPEVDIAGPKGLKYILWFRGLIGSTGMTFLYFAIDMLPAGNAVTLSYVRMVLVPFLARILLKESLSVIEISFALVALTGVVFITQPTFLFPDDSNIEHVDGLGVLFALLSSCCMALSVISVRKLGKETHPALQILYYGFSGAITTLIILVTNGEFKYPCWHELPMLFSVGILAIAGQFFATIALQRERTGIVVVLRSVQIIFVYFMQVTILGDVPSHWSLIGAALIFLTSVAIGVRKVLTGKRQRSKS